MYRHSHTGRIRGGIALFALVLMEIGAMAQGRTEARPLPEAMTQSQPPMPPASGVKPAPGMPKAMAPESALLYRKIFMYQAAGDIKTADAILKKLTDTRLRGAVLFQRYIHPTAYKPKFQELEDWLNRYADQPGADRVYRMALNRTPKGYKGTLAKPRKASWIPGLLPVLSDQGSIYKTATERTPEQTTAIQTLKKSVRLNIRRGEPELSLKSLETDQAVKWLDTIEYDQLRGEIAKGFLDTGKLDKARKLAMASARRSGADAPDAGWIGGLTAWRQKDYKAAATLFGQVAVSPYASRSMASAGAYWASRAAMRSGDAAGVRPWLEMAAANPRTFYGMLATRALGWDFDFNWSVPEYTEAHHALLSAIPAFQRADALVATGQFHLAEAELSAIDPGDDPGMHVALMAYASRAGLPGLAMRLAENYARPEGGLYDAALYPLSPWKPSGGYRVDEALVDALIRQESRFNPDAQSNSGASGLMQLMPTTASYVSGATYQEDRAGRHALKDPQTNVDIGQRYVENLLGADPVNAELMSLLIAYNAGPGSLGKWKQQYADTLNDPLLFIESIPVPETRNYVERVMANYWIYRIRLGQPPSSLDEVAEGRWAFYNKPDPIRRTERARLLYTLLAGN